MADTSFLHTDPGTEESLQASGDLILKTEDTLSPFYFGHVPALISSVNLMTEVRDLLQGAREFLAAGNSFRLSREGFELPPSLSREDYNLDWLLMLGVQFRFCIGIKQTTLYAMLEHYLHYSSPMQTRLGEYRGFSNLNPQAALVLLETMMHELADRPSLSLFPAVIWVSEKKLNYSIAWGG